MKKFLIGGTIVDSDMQKWSFEDVTPLQVRTALKNLEDGEEITFEITSAGGSCTAGIAIANLIRQASKDGHKTTAHIIGLAASMASVIACAADKIQMDQSAFMMIHNPWTQAQGDAEQLRKEADTLDKFKSALLSFYRSKFNKSDEEIAKLMDDETWFTGSEASEFGLDCEVIDTCKPLRAAACAREIPIFNRLPNNARPLLRLSESKKDMNEHIDDIEVGEDANRDSPHAVEVQEQQEMITKAEADVRVSGMQSAMAKQIDALKKDFEAKAIEFQNQLKAKDEELTKAQNEVISLNHKLEDASNELLSTASALEERTKALATLNADVNTPSEELPTFKDGLSKCKSPKERVEFIMNGKYKI